MIVPRWLRSIVGVAAATAIGILAASIQLKGWAPLGLLPILTGAALGAMLSALVPPAAMMSRNLLIVGTILLSLLAVATEHAWLYRDFRRQWREARAENAQVAQFRLDAPWSPAEYFGHEFSPRRAVLWCVDALLVVAAAIGTVLMSRHSPPIVDL